MPSDSPSTLLEEHSAEARIAALEAELKEARAELAEVKGAHARVREAYMRALEQLQLLRRRLFLAKAERRDVAHEQLAFDAMFEKVRALEAALEKEEDAEEKKPKRTPKPHGRRDLAETNLPVVRVEITDPHLEEASDRMGIEETSRLGYERGGFRRIVVARVVYKRRSDGDAPTEIVTAPLPKELFKRSLLAPSTIAHLLVSKYLLGVPFYRLEQQMALSGVALDRGTMCRYAEDAGATLGAIVLAMRDEAIRTAFCLSTDATGIAIQPGRMKDRATSSSQACKKGHFFVVLADRDHVFFEYQPKHTSAAVCAMFEGYSGYIQADAHTVYDALFRGRASRDLPSDASESRAPPPIEVGCWAHARRNFWEAAACKHDIGREGLRRINAIFELERHFVDLPPSARKAKRDTLMRPLVEAFFAWVHELSTMPRERGLVASALGYAKNQQEPLCRFLENGRLRLDNNPSERALRAIAAARKVWMFFGSDDHAAAAANLFSLIASCKLHGLDAEAYFAEVIRVMPYWPRERYLELAPRYWAVTRSTLDANELAAPLGRVTLPRPLPAEEKPASK